MKNFLVISLLLITAVIAFAQPTWEPFGTFHGGLVWVLGADSSGVIYLQAESNEIYKTTDQGETWSPLHIRVGRDTYPAFWIDRNKLFRFSRDTLFYSLDHGDSWLFQCIISDRTIAYVHTDNENRLYLATYSESHGTELRKSTNGGVSWTNILPYSTSDNPQDFLVTTNDILIVPIYFGIYRSVDHGVHWTNFQPSYPDIYSVFIVGMFGSARTTYIETDQGLWVSRDTGATWQRKDYPESTQNYFDAYCGIMINDSTITVGSYGCWYMVFNYGDSWVRCTDLSPESAFIRSNQFLVSLSQNSLVRSSNNGITWTRGATCPDGDKWSHFFVDSFGNRFYSAQTGFYRCMSGSNDWVQLNSAGASGMLDCQMTESPQGDLYAYRSGVYRSTDHGVSWTLWSHDLLDSSWVYDLFFESNSRIIANTNRNGPIYTNNGGEHWIQFGSNNSSMFLYRTRKSGNTYISWDMNYLYRFQTYGSSWELIPLYFGAPDPLDLIRFDWFDVSPNGTIYATCDTVIFKSTNEGETWSQTSHININYGEIENFQIDSTGTLYVPYWADSLGQMRLNRSTDEGVTWEDIGAGLNIYSVFDIQLDPSGHLYCATERGVYRTTQPVSVGQKIVWQALPGSFSLQANYPNPFNSTTTIRFSLPKPERITLSVMDEVGRKVGDLFTQTMTAGNHVYRWNATGLASGTYFISMKGGSGERVVRKVQLVK